jgi:hypothetical protein
LPPGLGSKGRDGFAAYLLSGPHKAFAASAKGGVALGERGSAGRMRQNARSSPLTMNAWAARVEG